jgi:hypothetical protein
VRGLALVCCVLMAGIAFAEAPKTSIFPKPRPALPAAALAEVPPAPQTAADSEGTAALAVAPAPAKGLFAFLNITPKPRPKTAGTAATKASTSAVPSLAPRPRPKNLNTQLAAPSKPSKKASAKGSVCGDPTIIGQAIAAIPAKVKGCGLAEPVRLTSVSGVSLNPAATIGCPTALALKAWIDGGLQPAFGNNPVIELKVAASYVCRTRNNIKGARASEHARGNAIDIGGFTMRDGTTWTVARNYNSTIRKAHKAACGTFGTTLGPGSDGFHEDHLHFDIARYSNDSYCR